MLCDTCQTGKEHLDNIQDAKDKKINKTEFLSRTKKLGSICTVCIHNTVGKRKGKVIKKLYPSFKSVDMYRPIEVEKNAKVL